jgi:alkylhydroperoxidase family enzyme
MPLIHTVAPSAAHGPVAAIFQEIEQVMGRVPGGMQLYAASPALLAQQWQVIGYYARHPRLSFAFSAAVRMLVSQENDCGYCIGFNAALLINHCGWTAEQVAATKRDVAAAPLEAKEKALLRFVLETVNARQPATRDNIDGLVKLGWSESDILDAVALGARNIAVDIIFNAFQIEADA